MCDGIPKKQIPWNPSETTVKQQWNPSLPKATLVCKKITEEKTRRRRRTRSTRETKCFPFPLLKQYWTGSCWPVCQCDEFRLIWECEVCGKSRLLIQTHMSHEQDNPHAHNNDNYNRIVRERGRQMIQKMCRVEQEHDVTGIFYYTRIW